MSLLLSDISLGQRGLLVGHGPLLELVDVHGDLVVLLLEVLDPLRELELLLQALDLLADLELLVFCVRSKAYLFL